MWEVWEKESLLGSGHMLSVFAWVVDQRHMIGPKMVDITGVGLPEITEDNW